MEPIEVFKKTEHDGELEYMVIMGHGSTDVGFLVKVNRKCLETLAKGRHSPETLIKKTFRFLLKRQSQYSIPRIFCIEDIGEKYPEYEEEMKKRSLFWFTLA